MASLPACSSRAMRQCLRQSARSAAAAASSRRTLASVVHPQQSAASSSSSSSSSSPSSSSSWKPPLAPGIEPAYDEALAFLSRNQSSKRQQAQELRQQLEGKDATSQEGRELQRRIEELEVLADLNDPAIRWQFENGQADLSRPVFRYLREQAWRRPFLSTSTPRPLAGQESRAHAGPLATLVQRARAMRVVPDVVPHATPTVDVQVYFGQGAGFGDHGGEGGEVLPGVFVDAAKTLQQPRIEATPFHVDARRYTLLLLDPDSPDEHKAAFRPYAHWLLEDVELSATQTSLQTGGGAGKEVLSYVPPHPQRGTPYHRYTVLLLSREAGAASGAADSSTTSTSTSASATTPEAPIQREAFDVRAYMQQRGLGVAGLHFWRGIWKEGPTAQAVEQVYRDVLGRPAPFFADPAKLENIKA